MNPTIQEYLTELVIAVVMAIATLLINRFMRNNNKKLKKQLDINFDKLNKEIDKALERALPEHMTKYMEPLNTKLETFKENINALKTDLDLIKKEFQIVDSDNEQIKKMYDISAFYTRKINNQTIRDAIMSKNTTFIKVTQNILDICTCSPENIDTVMAQYDGGYQTAMQSLKQATDDEFYTPFEKVHKQAYLEFINHLEDLILGAHNQKRLSFIDCASKFLTQFNRQAVKIANELYK